MDKLPPDILCGIFSISLPSRTPFDEEISCSESISVPLLFTHICRSWRDLALLYGELWSHLCIDFATDRRKARRKKMAEIFDTWLSRTKDAPLNYVFFCELDDERDVSIHRDAEHIITSLVSQQHRWRNMHLVWSNVKLSRDFPRIKLTSMPILQSLTLSSKLARDMASVPAIIDLAQAPQLRHLHLDGTYDLRNNNNPIRYTNEMATLKLSTFMESSVENCLHLLAIFRHLTEFHVSSSFAPPSAQLSYQGNPGVVPVVLPGLGKMVVYGGQSSSVMKWLTLPSLWALGISSRTEDIGEILLDLISRSSPPLSYLFLRCEGIDEVPLINALHLLPELRHFRLLESHVTDRFFRTLSERNDNGGCVICPHITTFNFRGPHFADNSYLERLDTIVDSYIDMLRSRWQPLGKFEEGTLVLSTSRIFTIDLADADSVASLREWFMDSALSVNEFEMPEYPFRSWDVVIV